MVLHLDNGQAWQELQRVSGDLSLQVGDIVRIDEHLSSCWLIGPSQKNFDAVSNPDSAGRQSLSMNPLESGYALCLPHLLRAPEGVQPEC
jgi:hypothetical protein